MNILRDAVWQAQTDTFLGNYNTRICGNDYTATTLRVVRNLFAAPPPSDPNLIIRPVFAAVNCISNSPNRGYREVLIKEFYNGGAAQDFSQNIINWRNVIDAVQAPPPRIADVRLAANNTLRFTVPAQRGRTNRVEGTTNFVNWTTITNITGTNAPVVVRDTNVLATPRRFYRILRL